MIIPIDDQYRLKSDTRQWMLQKYSHATEKNEETWKSFKYYTDPSSAVTELAHLMIRESDVETLVDALSVVDRVTSGLLEALTPHFNVSTGA